MCIIFVTHFDINVCVEDEVLTYAIFNIWLHLGLMATCCTKMYFNKRCLSCYLLNESSCPCYINIPTPDELIWKMSKPCAFFIICKDEFLDIEGIMCLRIGSKTILRAPWFTSSSVHCPITYSFRIERDD